MPNSRRPTSGSRPDFHAAAMEERVYAVERDVGGVRVELHEMRQTMASGAQVAALAAKLDRMTDSASEKARPQWMVVIAAAMLLLAIGALYVNPVKEQVALLTAISHDNYNRFVPRAELQQRWDRYDREFAHQQQQLQDLSARVGNQFTIKDAFDDVNKRIDRIQSIVTAPLIENGNGKRYGPSPPE